MTPPRDDDPVLGIVYELSLESRAYVGGRLGAEAYMTYIGQSCRRGYETPEQLLQQRWDEHVERRDVISPKKRQRRLLARAITRYGHSQFKKRVLHTTRGRRKIVKEWADAVEADLIDQRGTLNTNRGNRKRSAATEEEEATVSRGGKRARTTQREKGERPRDRGGTDGGQRISSTGRRSASALRISGGLSCTKGVCPPRVPQRHIAFSCRRISSMRHIAVCREDYWRTKRS